MTDENSKNKMKSVKLSEIENYAKRIAAEFNPQKIILFDSYSNDYSNDDSDIDILVIGNFPERVSEQAFKIRKKILRNFPVDLIVRDSKPLKKRLRLGDFFLQEIINNGKVLYE